MDAVFATRTGIQEESEHGYYRKHEEYEYRIGRRHVETTYDTDVCMYNSPEEGSFLWSAKSSLQNSAVIPA